MDRNIMKLCSFYVSKWHLVTMLLPYINKNVDEKVEIATLLENNIKENVEVLLKKLNLDNEQKILNINWNSKNVNKYSKISRLLEKNKGKEILLIINGEKEYIIKANKNIDRYIENNLIKLSQKNTKIKIVNCYEITEFNGSIVEILDEHDKILNTSGEKEITEIFQDYVRTEKIG